MSRFVIAAVGVMLAGGVASMPVGAQVSMPPNQVANFHDTSMLKPPPGAKVAIVEWEDLECPACARAFPIVHEAVDHYKIPLVRHDFLIPGHVWSHDAALYARYLQDKVGLDVATDYRRQIFASQFRIASKDDLVKLTQKIFASHGKQMPFVLDPELSKEVNADNDLGLKLGLAETPTIVVVTPKGWIQVKDVMQLYAAIDQAENQMAEPTAHKTVAKK